MSTSPKGKEKECVCEVPADKKTSACEWHRLPFELKAEIMKSLDLPTALNFCLVNKEAASFLRLGGHPSSPIVQADCEETLSDISKYRMSIEKIIEELEHYQKPFLVGSMKLHVQIDTDVDISLIHQLADIAGPQARRIFCHFGLRSDKCLPYLESLPKTITVVVGTLPEDEDRNSNIPPSTYSWLRKDIAFPSHVRKASLQCFGFDETPFSISCASLDRLDIDDCCFADTGCDLTGIGKLGYLNIHATFFTNWTFFNRLPRSIDHIHFCSVQAMADGAPQLPDTVKHVSFHHCNMMVGYKDGPLRIPASVKSIKLDDTYAAINLLGLVLSEGLLSLTILCTKDSRVSLEITKAHLDYIFPDSIRTIHIETNGDPDDEKHDTIRSQWVRLLIERHPRAEISIL